jgi:hypothetical protein
MPTLSKPKLKEGPSVWRTPHRLMLAELTKNKTIILEQLRFYCEHDRPEDFGGKFKKQVQVHEKAVLLEIAAALTCAASVSASISISVRIATLKKVRAKPELILKKTFPAAVLWIIAENYQRKNEKPGTYWPDVFGVRPKRFPGRIKKPASSCIIAAASRALLASEAGRTPGRPRNSANEALAEMLGPIFRRYNRKLTRHSIESSLGNGRHYQIDSGPFLTFAKAVLKPLQAYLKQHGLPNVHASGVLKQTLRLRVSGLPYFIHNPDLAK